jgi:hypothetical protein
MLELEAEIKAKEEESILFYWGVAMIVATAKNVAGTVTRACR